MCIAFKFLLSQLKKSWISIFFLGLVTLMPIPYFYSQFIAYQEHIIKFISTVGLNGDGAVLMGMVAWYVIMRGTHEFFWRVRDLIKIIVSTWSRFYGIVGAFNIAMENEYSFFESSKISSTVANTRQISENTERIFITSIQLLSSVAYIITIFRLVLERDSHSFKVLIISVSLYTVAACLLLNRAAKRASIASAAKDNLLVELYSTFVNIAFVFVYKTFTRESGKIVTKAEAMRQSEIAFEGSMLIIYILQAILFIWLTRYLVVALINRGSGVEIIVSIIGLMNDFVGKMWKAADDASALVENYGRLQSCLIALSVPRRLSTLLSSKPYIKLTNISFQTDKQKLLFPDLEIQKDEMVFVLGASGCGKSTLIEIILGLRTPSAGTVYNGLFDSVAYLPQNPVIFDNNLRYNITYGISDNVSDSEIEAILSSQIFSFIFCLGLDKQVCNADFSGGEIQKICLARILVQNKIRSLSLVVFDEPTSALDVKAEEEVFSIIKSLAGAKIIISHKNDWNDLSEVRKIYLS